MIWIIDPSIYLKKKATTLKNYAVFHYKYKIQQSNSNKGFVKLNNDKNIIMTIKLKKVKEEKHMLT